MSRGRERALGRQARLDALEDAQLANVATTLVFIMLGSRALAALQATLVARRAKRFA